MCIYNSKLRLDIKTKENISIQFIESNEFGFGYPDQCNCSSSIYWINNVLNSIGLHYDIAPSMLTSMMIADPFWNYQTIVSKSNENDLEKAKAINLKFDNQVIVEKK